MPTVHPRFTEVVLAWAAGLVACGSSTGLHMPQPGDAGADVVTDAFVEPELPECEGEHLVHRYVLDGETHVSECLPMMGGTLKWQDTGSTSRPDYRLGFGNPLPGDDLDNPLSGLPEPACVVGFVIDNLWPPMTGASGGLEQLFEFVPYRDERDRTQVRAGMALSYATEGTCRGLDLESAVVDGGTWEVVQGATTPGEWLTVEARDVAFEYLGRTILFEHMRWHVRLGEPSWPGP